MHPMELGYFPRASYVINIRGRLRGNEMNWETGIITSCTGMYVGVLISDP